MEQLKQEISALLSQQKYGAHHSHYIAQSPEELLNNTLITLCLILTDKMTVETSYDKQYYASLIINQQIGKPSYNFFIRDHYSLDVFRGVDGEGQFFTKSPQVLWRYFDALVGMVEPKVDFNYTLTRFDVRYHCQSLVDQANQLRFQAQHPQAATSQDEPPHSVIPQCTLF